MIGGGAIGLMLAVELRYRGADVLLLERGETGGEASWAAGGMIAHCDPHLDPRLRALAVESASLYPGWAERLRAETGVDIDLRHQGAILLHPEPTELSFGSRTVFREELSRLEPNLRPDAHGERWAHFAPEASLDPRLLARSLRLLALKLGIRIVCGVQVLEVLHEYGRDGRDGRASGVRSDAGRFSAKSVVNCAGAWAGQIPPLAIPTRPVKGHMLALPDEGNRLLCHVIRSPEVYLIPRTGGVGTGRIVIGATVEEAGFDKRVEQELIGQLHRSALGLLPTLAGLPILESWTGLRPATPDGLPILGETATPGYFAATGHYRDGILLGPVTAKKLADLLSNCASDDSLTQFSPRRFSF